MPVKRIWMSDGLIFRRQLVQIQPQAPVKLILGERIMIKCDYLIVGAGMAGSTLGYLLQKNGCDVIILEKEEIKKKDKVCAGLLSPRFYPLLTKIYPKEEIDLLVRQYFIGMDIYLDDIKHTKYPANLRSTIRQELDMYVVQKYQELSGRLYEQTKILEYHFDKNLVITNRGPIRYNNLIAADGMLSEIRKKVVGTSQEKIFIMQSYPFNTIGLNRVIVEGYSDFPGYTYLFPYGDKICVGSGGLDNKQVPEYLNKILDKYNLEKTPGRGHFLPTGRDIFLHKDNIYFIGDAAGLTSMPSGEGMYYACLSAMKLFQSFTQDLTYEELMSIACEGVKYKSKVVSAIEVEGVKAIFNNL